MARSRDRWKAKATARANENRYLRRQVRILRARAQGSKARRPAPRRHGLAKNVAPASVAVGPPLPAVPRAWLSPPSGLQPVSERASAQTKAEPAARLRSGKPTEGPPALKTLSEVASLDDAYRVRILSVTLVISAVVSFRSVPRILRITRPSSWCPHFTSVINWTLRFGLAKLQGVALAAEPWIAIVDASIDIGLSKVMVVLRVHLDALARRGSAITLEDCEVVGLKVGTTFNSMSVADLLEETFAKVGMPVAILKDGGSDLAAGTRLWRDRSGTGTVKVVEDIGHVAANALKHEFERANAFLRFMTYVRSAAAKLWQSDIAFLAPPRLRTKGRFQSITRLAHWATRLRPLLGGKGRADKGTLADRLRRLAGGLAPHNAFLERFTLACDVVENCLKILKNEGMNQSSYRRATAELARLPPTSGLRKRLERWCRRQLSIQARLGVGQMPLLVSSDILESLFGKFKVVLARNPKSEFNRTVLALPALCGKRTSGNVEQGLRAVTHRDLEIWESQHIPPTQQRARMAFNRGKLAPEQVPKTAHAA